MKLSLCVCGFVLFIHKFFVLAANELSLDILGKRLSANPKIVWSPDFNNNPMLMAQIQAGLIANEVKQRQQLVEQPEPNGYYRTMIHRSYDPWMDQKTTV